MSLSRIVFYCGLAFFLIGAAGIFLARFERAGLFHTGFGWGLDVTLPAIGLIVAGAVIALLARRSAGEAGEQDPAPERDPASTKTVILVFGLFFLVVGVSGLLMGLLQDMGLITWGFGSMLGFIMVTFMGSVIILISRRK